MGEYSPEEVDEFASELELLMAMLGERPATFMRLDPCVRQTVVPSCARRSTSD
jgi:hypothetical protein